MVIVLKRFGMDDVPVYLAKNWDDARQWCETDPGIHATEEDQCIADVDIGLPLCAFLLMSFDKKGIPVRSEVIPYGQ